MYGGDREPFLIAARVRQDFAPRSDAASVSECEPVRARWTDAADLRGCEHVRLVLDGPRPKQDFPVRPPGIGGERGRHAEDAGADILCVPAAFTAYTGRAHWEVLLRARAIENQAYVFAPAQVGRIGPASANRFAFGHACSVAPWGEVLADAGGDQEGLAVASVHPERLSQVRRDLPALQHRRRDVL